MMRPFAVALVAAATLVAAAGASADVTGEGRPCARAWNGPFVLGGKSGSVRGVGENTAFSEIDTWKSRVVARATSRPGSAVVVSRSMAAAAGWLGTDAGKLGPAGEGPGIYCVSGMYSLEGLLEAPEARGAGEAKRGGAGRGAGGARRFSPGAGALVNLCVWDSTAGAVVGRSLVGSWAVGAGGRLRVSETGVGSMAVRVEEPDHSHEVYLELTCWASGGWGVAISDFAGLDKNAGLRVLGFGITKAQGPCLGIYPPATKQRLLLDAALDAGPGSPSPAAWCLVAKRGRAGGGSILADVSQVSWLGEGKRPLVVEVSLQSLGAVPGASPRLVSKLSPITSPPAAAPTSTTASSRLTIRAEAPPEAEPGWYWAVASISSGPHRVAVPIIVIVD